MLKKTILLWNDTHSGTCTLSLYFRFFDLLCDFYAAFGHHTIYSIGHSMLFACVIVFVLQSHRNFNVHVRIQIAFFQQL